MIKRYLIPIAISVMFGASLGCTSYKTPPKNSEELAVIHGHTFNKDIGCWVGVSKINGLPVQTTMEKMGLSKKSFTKEFWAKDAIFENYKIQSGSCRIETQMHTGTGSSTGELEFNAEPGKEYLATCYIHFTDGFFNSAYVFFYVIDLDTGLPVTEIPEEYKSEILSAAKEQSDFKT